MMKSIPPDFTYVDATSSATIAKSTMRSEFRVGLYKDEKLDQEGRPTEKTVGCSWVCYFPGLGSLSCLTNGFSYSYEKFRGCQSKYLGVLQILIGFLCIAANIAGIVMGDIAMSPFRLNISQGIWGGVLIAIAGSFGLVAGKRKSKRTIIGLTLWTMIAAGAAATIIALTVGGTKRMARVHEEAVSRVEDCLLFRRTLITTERSSITANSYGGWWSRRNDYDSKLQGYNGCEGLLNLYEREALYMYQEKLAMCIFLIVLSIIAEFLFLWSFIICLEPVSCNRKTDQESSCSNQKRFLGAEMMKSIPPDFTYVDSTSSAAIAKSTMRSEFRMGLYKDEKQDLEGRHTEKTVGCSWVCHFSRLTNAFSYSYEKFRGCQSKYLGVLHILIGFLCIAANIAGIVMGARELHSSQGIWGGFLIAIAGSFGLVAGKRKSKCTIIALTLWTMIAAGAAAAIIALTVIETVNMVKEHGYAMSNVQRYGHALYDYEREVLHMYHEKLAMYIVLIALSIIAEFLFLWSFIICLEPFSCNLKTDKESSDSESAGLPQFAGYTVCPMPKMPNIPPYQSVNDLSINRPDLTVIQVGDKSVEKLPLTDHA